MIISDSSKIILSQTLGVAIEDEKRLMKRLEFDLATFYWSMATEAGRRVGALSVEMGFMWTIDSRRKNEKVEAKFWRHHSCSDKLPLTPHHILVISNLILAKNKKSKCGKKYLVFSTESKWRELCQRHAQLGFEYRLLDGPPWPTTIELSDLLGTLYAPVSKIPSVKGNPVVFWKNQLNRL